MYNNVLRYLALTIFIFLLFASCKKNLTEEHPEFKGNWISIQNDLTYIFEIDNNSYGRIVKSIDDKTDYDREGILTFGNDKIIFERAFTFKVITKPYELDSDYIFVLHDYDKTVNYKMKLKLPKLWGGDELDFYK